MFLKPCPCCGSEPKIVYGNDAYVKCPNCNMRGPGRYGNGSDVADYIDKDNAVMDWNALPRIPREAMERRWPGPRSTK